MSQRFHISDAAARRIDRLAARLNITRAEALDRLLRERQDGRAAA